MVLIMNISDISIKPIMVLTPDKEDYKKMNARRKKSHLE